MPLYLFHAPTLSLCKIGFANNIERRFKAVQTSCPAPLAIIAKRDGGRWDEAILHQELSGHRAHGEWFFFSDEVEKIFRNFSFGVGLVDCKLQHSPRSYGSNTLARWMSREQLTDSNLAHQLGVNHTSVMRWRRGLFPPDWKSLVALAEITNGAVMPNDFLPVAQKIAAASKNSSEAA